ncbi:hypothetical protein [Aurantivibrio plasticivorans]
MLAFFVFACFCGVGGCLSGGALNTLGVPVGLSKTHEAIHRQIFVPDKICTSAILGGRTPAKHYYQDGMYAGIAGANTCPVSRVSKAPPVHPTHSLPRFW